ncbi:hypothetical protein D4764_21G0006020 [Takifugu flavidus]|uniref:Uncharacterized protein n=1 Tax=Takifugu flavidus TaxID=433684 RepID=A0A5C6NDW2_9TELE|nr:hypothetical protein D4764_21G0006020 [Takifugu flavidus]
MAPQPQADGRLKPEPRACGEFVCCSFSLPWCFWCHCGLGIKNQEERQSCLI